ARREARRAVGPPEPGGLAPREASIDPERGIELERRERQDAARQPRLDREGVGRALPEEARVDVERDDLGERVNRPAHDERNGDRYEQPAGRAWRRHGRVRRVRHRARLWQPRAPNATPGPGDRRAGTSATRE